MTSYEEIYDLALSQIEDPLILQWAESDLEDQLHDWMLQSIYKLPMLKSELSDRDDTNSRFNSDLSDIAKIVLSMQMRRQWLAPQITSLTLTLQRSSKKEAYSSAEHMKELKSLDLQLETEIKKLLRDNTYIDNGYFG